MAAWLFGVDVSGGGGLGGFCRLGGALPEEEIPKDYHLRPLRLRRRKASHHALSSGEHSLPGVDLAGAVYLMVIDALIGAGSFLR